MLAGQCSGAAGGKGNLYTINRFHTGGGVSAAFRSERTFAERGGGIYPQRLWITCARVMARLVKFVHLSPTEHLFAFVGSLLRIGNG